jgi:hypothetical protein
MIVRNSGDGKSFKGLSDYLMHDPNNSKTDERVAWTHTLNLANDDVPSAVNEMYLTAENAELLKQEAGVRAGGRVTEKTVKHISLNWAPGEDPTREHMIETSEKFLRHMGWHEHQAILIAHDDKSYRHVHIMLNMIHPETGLRLNDDFEWRRAQEWALQYERDQDRIHCAERLKNAEDRERNMPRNIWMEFKVQENEFSRAEKILAEKSPEIPENPRNAEWKFLKELQRDERKEFFAQGKSEFKELRATIYREVREEFRERWADYYLAKKNGTEDDREILAKVKSQLISDQKDVLELRRDAACRELRESRDEHYRELLDYQKEMRAELRWRQEAGLDNTPFFNALSEKKNLRRDVTAAFREAGQELTHDFGSEQPRSPWYAEVEHHQEHTFHSRKETVRALEAGPHKVIAGVGSFLGTLLTDLTNLGSAAPRPVSAEERADQFREAAENTLKQHQQHEREEDDARWRARQGAYGE